MIGRFLLALRWRRTIGSIFAFFFSLNRTHLRISPHTCIAQLFRRDGVDIRVKKK
jgi:hypothetical protein